MIGESDGDMTNAWQPMPHSFREVCLACICHNERCDTAATNRFCNRRPSYQEQPQPVTKTPDRGSQPLMPLPLYLDTARMGRMSPSARWASQDFFQFALEQGCSLDFECLLHDGFDAWPTTYRTRFPGLHSWGGVNELKKKLGGCLGLSPDTLPLLAGRSSNLMKLAAKLLFYYGRRVLITDLAWPTYESFLNEEAMKENGDIDCIQIRSEIYNGEVSAEGLIEMVINRYVAGNCDGIFLPAVSHDGIRLPIAEILSGLRQAVSVPPFAVVDAAQAFLQVPMDLSAVSCDFVLAGSQKWLGSTLPLGIGVCPNPVSRPAIHDECVRLLESGKLDDPLLTFLRGIETGCQEMFSETVNLHPLFTCRGALADQSNEPSSDILGRRLINAATVRQIARMTGWIPLVGDERFHSACVLLQAIFPLIRVVPPEHLRALFHGHGIRLTCYDGGILRLSMPDTLFSFSEEESLTRALVAIGKNASHRVPQEVRALNAS